MIHAAELAAAPQGNNWKNNPSRLACGSCHDGIDWTTGAGKTVSGATTGHVGGKATSDALCFVCHDAVSIDMIYHQIKTDPTSGPNIPAGAAKIEYEIYKVTANGLNQPVVTFRILKNGSPVSFNAYTGTTDALAGTYYLTGLLTGFKGDDFPDKKRGVFGAIKRELRRRSAIEAVIGHMKNDGHLGRCYLKGRDGDAANLILTAVGHNLRLVLAWLDSLAPDPHRTPTELRDPMNRFRSAC